MDLAPPPTVLTGFGVQQPPTRMRGGQGQTWSAGDVVLKHAGSEAEASWCAEVLAHLSADGFRVPQPVRATDRSWVQQGWVAWSKVGGVHQLRGRWPEVLQVGQRFHGALTQVARPAFLDQRTNPWSVGDRVAWGESAPQLLSDILRPLLERLLAFVRPIAATEQVIHGDLPGNVLFAAGQPPAVIDFTPYFRPAAFGSAIVVADAIAWYEAPFDLIRHLHHVPDLDQQLARAAVYRLITADQVATVQGGSWAIEHRDAYLPVADLIGV
jgi:uncharacterized protein (TIGR02569 family)